MTELRVVACTSKRLRPTLIEKLEFACMDYLKP